MLEFLVGCGGGDEEAFLVACGEAADYAGSCNCGVADGDNILEFGFEDTARLSVLWSFASYHNFAQVARALEVYAPVEVL